MQGVDRGRDKVEHEKQLGAVGFTGLEIEIDAGNEMLAIFVGIFDALENDESQSKQNGARQQAGADFPRLHREGVHGAGNKKAGRQQDRGVRGADDDLGMPARRGEGGRIAMSIDEIAEDQPAEQQHLGRKEDPHAELGGLVAMWRWR